jgi:hypothetical protein
MKTFLTAALIVFGIALATTIGRAQAVASTAPTAPAADGPAYGSSGALLRPGDYREWVFLTSGLGVNYGPATAAASTQPKDFKTVFVNRESYRQFLQSGVWPEKTIFMLEGRQAMEDPAIAEGGRKQGPVQFLEAAVKDSARFPGLTWAYFSFDSPQGLTASANRLPDSANCYACHRTNTAVEQTFVQFYPTLFDVARQKGTIKPGYDAGRRIQ